MTGSEIRAFRRKIGMSVGELAHRSGVSRSHIYKVEQGGGSSKLGEIVEALTRNKDPVRQIGTRADCINGARPCPIVSCRHHLAIHIRFDHISERDGWMDDGLPTCSLDVADDGPKTLDEVANMLPRRQQRPLSRERIRQIENKALDKVRATGKMQHFTE